MYGILVWIGLTMGTPINEVDNWILYDNTWHDEKVWDDTKTWKD